jgi:hypothetical protein
MAERVRHDRIIHARDAVDRHRDVQARLHPRTSTSSARFTGLTVER